MLNLIKAAKQAIEALEAAAVQRIEQPGASN